MTTAPENAESGHRGRRGPCHRPGRRGEGGEGQSVWEDKVLGMAKWWRRTKNWLWTILCPMGDMLWALFKDQIVQIGSFNVISCVSEGALRGPLTYDDHPTHPIHYSLVLHSS